jgi:hypothetical protein
LSKPTIRFSKIKSRSKALRFASLRGVATGTQLAKVEVAIARVSKRGAPKLTWKRAKGTNSWSFKPAKKLAAGDYVIRIRITDAAGQQATAVKHITLTS